MEQFKRIFRGGPFLWLLIVVFLALVERNRSEISNNDKTKIEKGFEAGRAILDLITERDFKEALTKIGKSIAPFLGAFGPFLSLILAFIPGADSAELAYLKWMMKNIDNRFNRLDSRFDEVQRMIDWTKVAVNFGQIEQKILAMDVEFRLLYTGGAPAANRKQVFITHFESDYQLSGLKLYNAIVHTQGTFQENLGESVMRYTKNDRKKTRDFLLGIMRLLIQAVKIELAYYKAKGFETIAEQRKQEWETRIRTVKSNFEQVDRTVTDRYHNQSLVDIKKYTADNTGMSNEDFSAGLYNMLNGKYDWRVWFVIAYKPIHGRNKHTVSVCDGGHILFRQDGRNIVVASKDHNAGTMDLQRARTSLNRRKWISHDLVYVGELARNLYNELDKTGACAVAVINIPGSDVRYKGDPNRIVHRDLNWMGNPFQKMFIMIMFG
ncbi:unnamed protein product [Owenia fusiformis]|uniref:Uncharacterized protein n=1 Tax=Owenia fusiformis TaxID=6347 RepID=A0A8S4Q937_OWEFU|nr:unnamed protein product [Owenia fusiformis]